MTIMIGKVEEGRTTDAPSKLRNIYIYKKPCATMEEDPSVGEASWDQLLEREESKKKISAKENNRGFEPHCILSKINLLNHLSYVWYHYTLYTYLLYYLRVPLLPDSRFCIGPNGSAVLR
jgi:hypothetical protein